MEHLRSTIDVYRPLLRGSVKIVPNLNKNMPRCVLFKTKSNKRYVEIKIHDMLAHICTNKREN